MEERYLVSKVNKSLTRRLIWGGIPREHLLGEVFILVFFLLLTVFVLESLWGTIIAVFVFIGFHFTMVYAIQQDPDCIEIFFDYLKTKDYYISE